VVRHAHARERPKATTALGTRHASERRAPARAEGALAPTDIRDFHFVRHEDLPIAAEKYDPHPSTSTEGTRTNLLTQGVDDADLTLPEARQAAREDALGDGGLLLAPAERGGSGAVVGVGGVVVVSFIVFEAPADCHVSPSLTRSPPTQPNRNHTSYLTSILGL
jgi:hypothetical protein